MNYELRKAFLIPNFFKICIMKKIFYITVFTFLAMVANSQVSFTYDAAGNRVMRQTIRVMSDNSLLGKGDTVKTVIESKEGEFKIMVYPNPTTGILNVEANQQIESYKLLALNGQILLNTEVQSYGGEENFTIDFTELAAGSYILIIVGANGKQEFNIIRN